MGCAGSKPDEATTSSDATPAPKEKEKKMSITKRRIAVRANENEELSADEIATTTGLSDSDKEKIKKALSKTEIFGSCTEEQYSFLCNHAMAQKTETNDVVVNQGENGDHFYIVDTGVYKATLAQQDDKEVAKYGAEDSFGELALLYNAPRAATVTCHEGGRLWSIERKMFRHIMVQTGISNKDMTDGFFKSVSILSALTDEQRSSLSERITEITFKDSEYVCAVGDIADAIFFVKKGEVVATVGEEKKEVNRYHAGDSFGESCLEPSAENATRKANIVAVGPATLLKLPANEFIQALGSLTDLVSSNFKQKVMEGVSIEGTMLTKVLGKSKMNDLIGALVEQTFDKGKTVIEQGSENATFYVIKSGEAKVMQAGAPGVPAGGTRELAPLDTGKFFGERGILQSEPAQASIVADAEKGLVCYCLDKTHFDSIVGSSLKVQLDKLNKKREDEANKPDRPKFADLELRRLLGVGSFGRVKLVVHKTTGNTYALKCLRKAQIVATKQQSHVLNEKNILAMMDHPFILCLVNTYQDAGELYMLLELSLGGELFTYLAKKAPLSDAPAKFYVSNVVSMFSYMHSLNVIYRDLKPENLLLDDKGYLKLVDFGFAKIVNNRTWTLCGTPEYLCPEIIMNKGHNYGADWWCVGILAFECLTGTTPFVANDPMEGYRKIVKCRVPWPSTFSAQAKDFIDKLLCVDQKARLGCLKNGSKDVRTHKWFDGLDFDVLETKSMPAPYVPKIKSPTDDSNFDQFEDDGIQNYPENDFPREMFAAFSEDWV